MSYRWAEHTAELELQIEAVSEPSVFEDALRAIRELLGDGPASATERLEIALSSTGRDTLLAQWIDELVYRAETADFIADEVERLDLAGDRLAAVVRGHRGTPRHLVKGATYHGLRFEPAGEGYRANVVLDV